MLRSAISRRALRGVSRCDDACDVYDHAYCAVDAGNACDHDARTLLEPCVVPVICVDEVDGVELMVFLFVGTGESSCVSSESIAVLYESDEGILILLFENTCIGLILAT
jgi:hypothetical protein